MENDFTQNSEIKPVGKVYINIKRLIYDYNSRNENKLRKTDLAQFVIKNGAVKPRLISFIRKTKEDGLYELTITELYNMCLYLGISIEEFFTKYTKAK